ncbi:MAG: hypothetical protein K2P81_01840 [Bacteriovoracaceae bacterium]|nr:hypothetical protein [Bacteriovoracaceae bacterium]
MAVTYIFAELVDGKKFLHTLTQAAEKLNIELMPSKTETADLYFYTSKDKYSSQQGLRIAVGSWTKEQIKEKYAEFYLENNLLDSVSAQILLSWIIQRQELKKVSPLRHQLGNLVLILLGRIMRMKQNDGDDHIKSLETLHERLGNLYKEFEVLDVPRY